MDFFENVFHDEKVNRKINQRKRKYVLKDLNENELFETHEETYVDEFGFPEKIEEVSLHLASCQHIIHSSEELAGRCSKCGGYLCEQCGSILRCSRCLSLLCSDCSKLLGGAVYCSRCRVIVLLKKGSVGLHKILSKEFRE